MSVPRLPLREMTPTFPGRKMRGLNAGMMPTNASPGVTSPAVLGPTMRQPAAPASACMRITSRDGMCSVSTTSSFTPAPIASSAAASAAAGGMNITDTSTPPSFCAASRTEANTGTPPCISPARLGLTPPTMRVP